MANRRVHITIKGAVQGVGFRPFVYRLATELRLNGWVLNDSSGVTIEAEGAEEELQQLLKQLETDKPPNAFYRQFNFNLLEPNGYTRFEIKKSQNEGDKKVVVQPDQATCPECLAEVFDPGNRRFLYPFTNCTHCGPRYSIIHDLPYDRINTTMAQFGMCDDCRREYEDPSNRRFHAQPNACPKCGPHVELWDLDGREQASHQEAIVEAADFVKSGGILALKGLGGFQLIVDARNEDAVAHLRQRKHREAKPLALMVPSLELAEQFCEISELEQQVLTSPAAPITVLVRKSDSPVTIAPSVAPQNPTLGLMLPYTPLHHILMRQLNFPIVATSGNLSDEPICTDEHEALERLSGIADVFLVHNRPIERHVDDSVVRVMAGTPVILRRARGYAPFPIAQDLEQPETVEEQNHPPENPAIFLALGGHLKNSVAVNRGREIMVSQHIGDLNTFEATRAFHKVADDLPQFYGLQPDAVIHDLHPDYYSTQDAQKRNLPTHAVQHHRAHILSCMAEHGLDETVLGISWDGTGYGTDGKIWGGEFLVMDAHQWKRVATLRPFRLPGGDRAVEEPRRSALGLLYELYGADVFKMQHLPPVASFNQRDRAVLRQMLEKNINAPQTTSAGRLFDAVASLLDLRQQSQFEGQAAMALEQLASICNTECQYPFKTTKGPDDLSIIDWRPVIEGILQDLESESPICTAAKFHNTLAKIILEAAQLSGQKKVLMSGGCFQNKVLLEKTAHSLKRNGFTPYWNQQVPPNDGGIAVGQLYYAMKNL